MLKKMQQVTKEKIECKLIDHTIIKYLFILHVYIRTTYKNKLKFFINRYFI